LYGVLRLTIQQVVALTFAAGISAAC